MELGGSKSWSRESSRLWSRLWSCSWSWYRSRSCFRSIYSSMSWSRFNSMSMLWTMSWSSYRYRSWSMVHVMIYALGLVLGIDMSRSRPFISLRCTKIAIVCESLRGRESNI
jgi:hypothetical protein